MKHFFLLLIMGLSYIGNAQIKDVSYMEYTYNNKGCNGFKYSSGSLIFIPNDAFCMEDGSSCKGTIKIKYREFHSQTDMVVGNLNMLLSRGGKTKILESAGMFEIRAECNGKPMKLCDGKTIQVRMNCRRKVNDLAAFRYDEKTRRWFDYGQVYDFSYNKTKPANDDNKWGNAPINNSDSSAIEQFDPETNQPYNVMAIYGWSPEELPDGYFQGMNIKDLGYFNYDGVYHDENAVPMVPEFVVSNGEPIGEKVCVAYVGRNIVVTYYPDDFAENFVLLNNTKGIKIFSKLKDGSFATLKEGSLDNANINLMKGSKVKFVLEKQAKKPKTKEELAAVTKISNN